MTPNQQQTNHPDDLVIDLSRPEEVEYWTEFFQCTEVQLRSAIALIGPLTGPIWRYLAIIKDTPTL